MRLQITIRNLLYRALRRWNARVVARRSTPNCLLVLQYMLPLGGCVHATPLFEALHESFPNQPIYVATRAVGAEVLRHNPSVAGLLVTCDVFAEFRKAGKALKKSLRKHELRPAWVITDASNRRSKIALLNSLYVQAPLIGFNLATELQTVTLEIDPAQSLIANNLAIAGALGADMRHREPKIYASATEIEAARLLLQEVNPQGKPVVIFSTQPSGGQPTEWRDACWREVMRYVVSQDVLPVFVGLASQVAAIERIRAGIAVATASLAGRTNITTLAAVLALSDACISIDTGTLHVARGARVPLVALAPTFQDPVEWLRHELTNAQVVRGAETAPVGPDYRLNEIKPADVIAAIRDLLETYPPRPESRHERLAALLSSVDHLADV